MHEKRKLLKKVSDYAKMKHRSVNQLYDDRDYEFHLEYTYRIAKRFIYLIPEDAEILVYCACWVHDIIEDTRTSYNDLKKNTNTEIADLAYALTEEKGKTRLERESDNYFDGIRKCKYATFVKLCDRIANIEHSWGTRSRMFNMYKKENERFTSLLYDVKYDAMFKAMHELLSRDF